MNNKNAIIVILVILLLVVSGFFLFRQPEDRPVDDVNGEEWSDENYEDENDEEDEEITDEEERLREIVLSFLGAPYESSPLDDEDNIYRDDAFNSTTLVLVSAAKFNFPDDPEEGIREIHYYPAGEVSYENRLHFSTYRNKISPFFEDITSEIGGEYTESKTVLLNKEREEGRLLDMEWEEEISLEFIRIENFDEIIDNLPEIAGVAFIVDGDEEIGLDVRSEGILVDGESLIHAPASEEEVVEEDIFDFLERTDYDGLNFFKFND